MPSPRLLLLATFALAGCVESDASVCSGDDDCPTWQFCTNGICRPVPYIAPLDERVRDAVEIDQPWPDMDVMRSDAEIADEGPFDGPCASNDERPRSGGGLDHSDAVEFGEPDHDFSEPDAPPLDDDGSSDADASDADAG